MHLKKSCGHWFTSCLQVNATVKPSLRDDASVWIEASSRDQPYGVPEISELIGPVRHASLACAEAWEQRRIASCSPIFS
jgi:hypothetical protein